MRGVVAAGNPYTAEAAAELLRAGGNAVDAACAGAFATFVAEPLLASAGGAGLGTVALRGQPPQVVDFFSCAPGLGGGAPEHPAFEAVEIDFKSAIQTFHVGRGSVAVPLALPGLAEAVRRFGTRPLAEVVAPAVRMCRAGVPLTPEGSLVFTLLWPILIRDPATVALYSEDQSPPPSGHIMHNPELADTLEAYGQTGELPESAQSSLLDWFGPAHGGLLTAEDFDADVTVHVLPPLEARLGDWEVFTSPRVGGHLVKGILEALGDAPEETEIAEVKRLAAASRKAHLARAGLTVPGNTTHVSVLDGQGNAAAITLTNGEGCGHLIPGTGIQMNNFLGEEDLNPHGFHLHHPGERLPTMVAPTVALHHGEPVLALGSGGANRIRSSVSQVLYRIATRGQALESAVMAPRVHAETDEAWLELEGRSDPDAVTGALESDFGKVFTFPKLAFFFGGVHAVLRNDDGSYSAFGDPRRGGASVVVD